MCWFYWMWIRESFKGTPGQVNCAGDTCTIAECCENDTGPNLTVLRTNVNTLTTDVTSIKTDITGIKSRLTTIETDITTLKAIEDTGEGEEESWFSSITDLFNSDDDDSEGFSNKTNKLFFIIALLIILYFCLQR